MFSALYVTYNLFFGSLHGLWVSFIQETGDVTMLVIHDNGKQWMSMVGFLFWVVHVATSSCRLRDRRFEKVMIYSYANPNAPCLWSQRSSPPLLSDPWGSRLPVLANRSLPSSQE